MPLTALALNATLKPSASADKSSTESLLGLIIEELDSLGVKTETIRLADHDIKPGVTSDEGQGDAWPAIREKNTRCRYVVFRDAHMAWSAFQRLQKGVGAHGCISGRNR